MAGIASASVIATVVSSAVLWAALDADTFYQREASGAVGAETARVAELAVGYGA